MSYTHTRLCGKLAVMMSVLIITASLPLRADTPHKKITPHEWHLTLNASDIPPDDMLSSLTLSQTQIHAQLGEDISDKELTRYVRDRIHVEHDGARCHMIYFKQIASRNPDHDALRINTRLTCPTDISPARIVASSTLFAAQRHPIPLFFTFEDHATQPPKLIATATFDSTHTIYPEGATLTAHSPPTPTRPIAIALLTALAALAGITALAYGFWRWSTTTR